MKSIPRTPVIIAGLVLLTTFALWPVLKCGFIAMDDDLYVTKNPHVLGGITFANAAWFFTHSHEFLYHPLSLITFMFDHALFGLNPAGYHAENLIIHIGSSILLFALLQSLTGSPWRSAAAAALFAVHPLRVESVAWVSERKDVLAVFFGLLAFLAYVRFAKGREDQPESRRPWAYYGLVVVLLMLSLLAKPALVTFPFLLLVLDFWPLCRAGTARRGREMAGNIRPTFVTFAKGSLPLVLEKLPLITIVVFWAYLSRSLGDTDALAGQMQIAGPLPSLSDRVLAAPVACIFYLINHVRLTRLAIPYPMPPEGWPISYSVVSLAILIAITALLCWQWRRWPWLVSGWAWFLIAVAPFLGIVYIGDYALADRYTYLADIGLAVAIVWSIPLALTSTIARKCVAASAMTAVLLILVLFSRAQARYWRDDAALFAHAVQVTDGNATAWCGLAIDAMNHGNHADAIVSFKRAAAFAPDERIYNSIGVEHGRLGNYSSALEAYHKAIRINPQFMPAYHNLAISLRTLAEIQNAGALTVSGDPPKTIGDCRRALEVQPRDPALHARLGELLDVQAQSKEAMSQYRAALRLDPARSSTHINLAMDLADVGRFDEAIDHYHDALALSPDSADAHYNLGITLQKLGHTDEAAHEFRETLRLRPSDADARSALNGISGR